MFVFSFLRLRFPTFSDEEMFLGYMEARDNFTQNPTQMFGVNEVQIASDLSFVSERHTFVDNLLGLV